MPLTVAFAQHKGGTGKSMVCVQTAGALARAGHRVLVVDMDPQANATRRLGITWDATNPIPSVSEALVANTPGAAAGAVTPCRWRQPEGELIDVVPARFDLLNREAEAGQVGALRRLSKALDGWIDSYDYVLIDTRPDLGHLVQMALAAANAVVIVTDAGYDSAEAAIRLQEFVVANATDLYNPTLTVAGVVINRVRDTAEARYQLEGLRQRFGNLIWQVNRSDSSLPAHIPLWSRFEEADGASCSLTAWGDARSRTCIAIFDQIAARIANIQSTAL